MVVCLVWAVFSLAGDDWYQWRGPARDGHAPHMDVDWKRPPEKVWSVAVGAGYGAPVVADGRVFVLTGKDDRELIIALEAETGKRLWQAEHSIAFEPNPYATRYGNGPFSTPLVVGKRVVTVGVTGRVSCFDTASGTVHWGNPYDAPLNDKRTLFCGNTVSPIFVEGAVIVHRGHEDGGEMIALDLETGTPRWTWTGDIPGYASPVLAELAGRRQLVCLTQNMLAGIDRQTGKTLWSYPWQVQWRENIPDPVVFEDTVIISGRENGETVAVAIVAEGDGFRAEKRWSNDAITLYCASPVLKDARLFGLSHKQKGQYFALNARSGETIWTSAGRQAESAQPILAGNALLFVTVEGRLAVLNAKADDYAPIADHQLSTRSVWAYPVPLEDGLLIKDASHLTRLRFH